MIDFTDFSKQGIKFILTCWAIFALGIFACEKAYATGTGTLNWTAYSTSHYAPYVESSCYNNYSYLSTCNNTNWAYVNSTPIATGTTNSLNYNWNSGSITIGGTNIGSTSRMLVITGYWQHPGTAGQTSTVYFAGRNDDGLIVNINDTAVISDWAQQGPRYWNSNGSFTGVGGQWYPIVINWYEWGGSANMDIHYRTDGNNATNTTSGWLDHTSSMFSTSLPVTTVTPTSGQSTLKSTGQSATGEGVKVTMSGDNNSLTVRQAGNNNFIVGTNWSDNAQVSGDNNTLSFNQGNILTSGSSGNNGLAFDITGNSNTVNVAQGENASDTGGHRLWFDIDGNSNTMNLTQNNDGNSNAKHFMYIDIDADSNNVLAYQKNNGEKTLFLDINNNSNDVDIFQYGTGDHFLDVLLDTGNYAHDVDITQDGSGSHGARIDLSGYSYDFDLTQNSGTGQHYTVEGICGQSGGCTLSTTQN